MLNEEQNKRMEALMPSLMKQYYMDSHCQYTEVYSPEHIYTYEGPCVITCKMIKVEVQAGELYQMRKHNTIMELRSVSADDREFLMNGCSAEGWTVMFGEQHEEAFDPNREGGDA